MLAALFAVLDDLKYETKVRCAGEKCVSRNKNAQFVRHVCQGLAREICTTTSVPLVPLCETCVHAAVATWRSKMSSMLASLQCREIFLPESQNFAIEACTEPNATRRVEFRVDTEHPLQKLCSVRVTIDLVREQELLQECRAMDFAEAQDFIARLFAAPWCEGLDGLQGLELREMCEGYAEEGANRRGFQSSAGNRVRFLFGKTVVIGAFRSPSLGSNAAGLWRAHSERCEQLCSSDSQICSACTSMHSNVRHAARNKREFTRSITDDFEHFVAKGRLGDGRFSGMSMTDLQITASQLWKRSDLRDARRNWLPGGSGSYESDDDERRTRPCTRSSGRDESDLRTAHDAILKERLDEIGIKLMEIHKDLVDIVEQSQKLGFMDSADITTYGFCADFIRRWSCKMRGKSVNGLRYQAATMNFCTAAFQRTGINTWMLLREALPIPHESTLREATRGVVSEEGIKFLDIKRNLVAAIARARVHRLKGDPHPDAAFDLVLSFDEMRVREAYAFDRGHSELRGLTTELTFKSAVAAIGEDGAKKRIANSWLSFVATPLLGGHTNRFTVAGFAVRDLTSGELLMHINATMAALTCAGFRVRVLCCDGASYARRVQERILTHSEADILANDNRYRGPVGRTRVAFEDPIFRYQCETCFCCFGTKARLMRMCYRGEFVHFISDPSHLIKKFANNLFYSRPGGTRVLFVPTEDGSFAHLDFDKHLKGPFMKLQSGSTVMIEPPLAPKHFDRSTNTAKMDVSLAAQLQSQKMVRVLERFLSQNPETAQDRGLNQSIHEMQRFIGYVDRVFDVLNGRRKETEISKKRKKKVHLLLRHDSAELNILREFSAYLQQWKCAIANSVRDNVAVLCGDGVTRHLELHKNYMTWQTDHDAHLCLDGVTSFITYYTVRFGRAVFPRSLSTDAVENHFCSIRAFASSAAPSVAEIPALEASASIIKMFNIQNKKANVTVDGLANEIPTGIMLQPRKRRRQQAKPRLALGELSMDDLLIHRNAIDTVAAHCAGVREI